MSGEKRAAADPSWEFTAGLVRGILIGGGIVQDRSCVGGRRAACWEKAGGGGDGGWMHGWEQFFFVVVFGGGVEKKPMSQMKRGRPC